MSYVTQPTTLEDLGLDGTILNFQGDIDCSTNPNYPAATAGDNYFVTVAGKIGGASGPDVEAGDMIICKTTGAAGTHATAGARWFILDAEDPLTLQILGTLINSATAKDTPVDADLFGYTDTEAGNITKKISWANIKATLKTYFDTFYLALSGGTLTGDITLGENTSIVYDTALSADGKYSGHTRSGTAGATLAFGELCYLDPTDSRWEKVDANAASGADGDARGILGMCVLAAAADGDPTKMLILGTIRADSLFPTLTINAPIYASETAGVITQTAPTTTDAVVRTLGFALTADEFFFNPASDYITRV